MSMYQTYLHEHVVPYNSAIADKLYNSVITNTFDELLRLISTQYINSEEY